jgi:hypothetical protein
VLPDHLEVKAYESPSLNVLYGDLGAEAIWCRGPDVHNLRLTLTVVASNPPRLQLDSRQKSYQ